jgi:hypothetical protein
MKPIGPIIFLIAVIVIPALAEFEPVGDAGPQVSVIVCGEVNAPKKVTVSSGAGVRGALLLAKGASDYGWLPRTQIWRQHSIFTIGTPDKPDVRLKEGDVIQVPLRAPYEGMSRPHLILVEVDSEIEFKSSDYNKVHFDISGTWRANWLGETKCRELRLTDGHTYHSALVYPCPETLKVAKSADTPLEAGLLDETKNYILLRFSEIRATTQEPKHADREAKIISAICQKLGGKPYSLNRSRPRLPWVLTPFNAQKK